MSIGISYKSALALAFRLLDIKAFFSAYYNLYECLTLKEHNILGYTQIYFFCIRILSVEIKKKRL